MRQLLLNLLWLTFIIHVPQIAASEEEAQMRASPKITICNDVLPPPNDCWEKDGEPLLQIRYPKELKTGSFSIWTVETMPGEALDLVFSPDLNHTKNATSLWGRMYHDAKVIILHVPDIMMYGPYRGDSIRMLATWRARSTENDMVLVDDEEMGADVVFFYEADDSESRRAHMEIMLGGGGMAMASWIEGRWERAHDEMAEAELAESIRTQWQDMGDDTRKADRLKVEANWGIIRDYSKDEL